VILVTLVGAVWAIGPISLTPGMHLLLVPKHNVCAVTKLLHSITCYWWKLDAQQVLRAANETALVSAASLALHNSRFANQPRYCKVLKDIDEGQAVLCQFRKLILHS
jgi:hypothetical protein